MRVYIPGPLRSYTAGDSVPEFGGSSVSDVLNEIERHCPGFRFRVIDEQNAIREHIKIFVNEDEVGGLSRTVGEADVLHIICALSGCAGNADS